MKTVLAAVAQASLTDASFDFLLHLPPSSSAGHKTDPVESCCAQGLAGLILETGRGEQLSQFDRNRLEYSARNTASRNLVMLDELARIARAFALAGVPLMALKGAALNLTLYPRLDLRPMCDLDLLVRPNDAGRAVEILLSLGYASGATLLRDDFFPKFHYEKEMILPGASPVRIDLHAHPWRPMHLAQLVSAEAFWKDAINVPLDGATVQVPARETMFIHLAAHAAFHGCARPLWLYDLKRFVNTHGPVLDWQLLADRAAQWRLSLSMLTALKQAEALFAEFCPRSFVDNLSRTPVCWPDRLSLWHAPRDAASPVLHVLCNCLSLSGVRDKLSYLAAVLTPGISHLGEVYSGRHPGWTWCAHLVRAVRALRRIAMTPWAGFRAHTARLAGGVC